MLIVIWLICWIGGTALAASRNIPVTGSIVCFLLGPLGVLAVLLSDAREQCPYCLGRLPVGNPAACCHCGRDLPAPKAAGKAEPPELNPGAVVKALGGRRPKVGENPCDPVPPDFMPPSRSGLR
jgi:hypothetical protein